MATAPRAARARACLLAALAIAASAVAWAQPPPAPLPTRVPEFPLARLQVGLEGYGLTALPGGGIGSFPVTVLALQEQLGPGLPLVLVRAGGDLIEAAGGVAAGMSGSPIYLPLDGSDALLGGIGYIFPESDGNLALITPIGLMREQTAGSAVEIDRAALTALGAVPAATLLSVGGLGVRALDLLQQTVLARSPYDLRAVQAGGGAPAQGDAQELEPGAAIAVQLVRGDVSVSAIGTVTELAGDELLAFAHAFLGGGPAAWPLAHAEVTAVVPSRNVPFRLANVGAALLGSVTQDRPAGISAHLGRAPALIPVTLTVTAGSLRRTLRFEVAADERLWPALVAVATLEAVDRSWQRVGAGTAEVAWEVELPGGADLRLSEQTAHATDLALATARLALAPLALLAENAFESPRPSALRLAVTLDERRRDAEVVDIVLEDGALRAGGVIALALRLQPWRRASEVRTLTAVLPADLHGELELRLRGGGEPRYDEEEADLEEVLLSYGELLTALRERPQGADLVLEVREAEGRWRELERLSLAYVVRGARALTIDVSSVMDDTERAPAAP